MAYQRTQRTIPRLGVLVRKQHGVVTRGQLLGLGLHPDAVKHRVASGRLHPIHRGVYAVGRPQLDRLGEWIAAVLACGTTAILSHASAASLWGFWRDYKSQPIVVSVLAPRCPHPSGITVHRRAALLPSEVLRHRGIPVTSPALTLIDLARTAPPKNIERAVNEADRLKLVTTDHLRELLDDSPRRPGVGVLRTLLDRRTFRLTDSELERRFIPLARGAGLTLPETRRRVNGFKVDFWWPKLGLVVETDGLTYHRTPLQQTVDLKRDQTHTASGLTALRFSHDQIAHEPIYVRTMLCETALRLGGD